MKALQESRRESMALDKRLERAAAIQREKEKAAESVRVKADAQLAAERGPDIEASSAKPALGNVPVLLTRPELAPDRVVVTAPDVPAPAQLSARRFSPGAPSAGEGVFIQVSRSSQTMRVIVDGKPRYSWRVSTGRAGYETPAGTFSPMRLAREHYSREWDDAPMPHSIFFTGRGHAIHGSNDTRRLGRRASHGCVRLAPSHAATLFALVQARGLNSTKVTIAN